MFDPQSNVPMHVTRNAVEVYGKQFPFTPHSSGEREAAIRQAKQFGAARQRVMQQQAGGRPLTAREQILGDLDLPAERSKPHLIPQPPGPDPNRNHWLDRLDELQRQVAYTTGEKVQLQRRVEFATRMAEQWDAEHSEQEWPVNEDIARLRRHAAECYDQARNDPNESIAGLVTRKRLLALANSDDPDVGRYWDEVREIELDQPASLLPRTIGGSSSEWHFAQQ